MDLQINMFTLSNFSKIGEIKSLEISYEIFF